MLFNSAIFLLVFLPIVLAGYFLLGMTRAGTLAKGWLLLASIAFYAWWNPPFVLLLIGSILVNFVLGGLILSRARHGHAAPAKAWLTVGVVLNLAVLGYYKYRDFFLENVATITGSGFELEPLFLPLAISFFTFQQVAYLVDASKAKVQDHNLVNYALFVSFFPQLIAGPIVHHADLMPQFRKGAYRFNHRDFAEGIAFLVMGLAKKVLIADTLAALADPVFDGAAGHPPGLFDSWVGVLAFALGIYFDFSGYSDMAVGLGRMMGIRLPYNFASPYKAASISEFWRRWHITLSDFLRDYVYIPLGGNRRGKSRRYVNLMITMLLGGLWHGAGWTFVIWGGLHGLYLTVNHGWNALRRARPDAFPAIGPHLGRALTLGSVLLAWVFFRAGSMAEAGQVLAGMAGMNGFAGAPAEGASILGTLRDPDTAYGLGLLAFSGWLALNAPNSQELIDGTGTKAAPAQTRRRPVAWQPNLAWAGIMAVGFVLALLQMSQAQEFIYFQF